MIEIPSQLVDIAGRLGRNERLKRRSVETLLKWFGASKRGSAVTTNIRAALRLAGLETDPDFTEGGVHDFIAFRQIRDAAKAGSALEEFGAAELAQAEFNPGVVAESDIVEVNARSAEDSDDFLESEDDDEQPVADDDRPVFSRPADWTITALREKWEGGCSTFSPIFSVSTFGI